MDVAMSSELNVLGHALNILGEFPVALLERLAAKPADQGELEVLSDVVAEQSVAKG